MALKKQQDEYVLPSGIGSLQDQTAKNEAISQAAAAAAAAKKTQAANAAAATAAANPPYGSADPNNLSPQELLILAQQGLSAGQKVGGGGQTAIAPPGILISPPGQPAQPPASAPAPAPAAAPAQAQDPIMAALAGLSSGGNGSTIDLSAALAALQGGQGAAPSSILPDLQSLLGAAPTPPSVDINKEAQNQIDLQYGGQEDAIKNALQSIASQTTNQQNQQTQYGQTADASLANIFAALQSQLGQGQQASQQLYGDTGTAVGNSYDTAQQGLQGLNSDVLAKIQQSLGGLGIQQAASVPVSRIEEGYQQQQGANIANKATALAGLDTSAANQNATMQNFADSAARQGATTRSDLATSVQQALANIGLAGSQAQNQQISSLATLEKQKPLDLANLVTQLTQTQYQQQEQAQQDRLAQITGLGNLDVANQKNQIDAQGNQTSLQTALAKILSDQATSQAQINATTNNPLTNAKTISEIENNQANTDNTNAKTTQVGQVAPTASTTYPQALESFLQSPQTGMWGTVAGPSFSGEVSGLISGAQGKTDASGKALPAAQEYQAALDQLRADPNASKYNQQGLLNALSLYFTGKPLS